MTLSWSTVSSVAVPVLIGAAYFRRVVRLRAQDRQPSALRQLSFAAGLAVVVIASVGPLDRLSEELVVGHMVEHTLLIDEASLLLALGLTGPILAPVLGTPGLRRLQALTHPVVAVGLWLAVMYGWHAPPLYQAAVEHQLVHLAEHACFIGAGVNMWLALLGPLSKPEWFGNGARAISAGAVHFSSMGLANILMWSGTALYPVYAAGERAHGISPVTDQGIAGVVLMVQSVAMMLGIIAWLVLRWASEDTERQELLDLALERGVALDPGRARRAVAAGRGGELRDRLLREGKAPQPVR